MDKNKLVYKITSSIPRGRVLTYGALAKLTGVKSPREVGDILHKNPDPKRIPCHRVVASDGRVAANYAFGGAKIQAKRLRDEGIEVVKNKVDVSIHIWRPMRDLAAYFELLSQ